MGKKPEQSPEQLAKRTHAYELYLKGILDSGQRASLRGIAMACGVTQTSVRYWRDKDRWEERVDAALTHRTVATTRDNDAVENLMRSGFYKAIRQLQQIIEDPLIKSTSRIRAIIAYGKLCKDFNVITPADLKNSPAAQAKMGTFKDDLPENAALLRTATAEAGSGDGGLQPDIDPTPIRVPESESGANGEWVGGGKSGDRASPVLEGSGLPSGGDEWTSPTAESEEEDGRDGGRGLNPFGRPTDTVLHDPDEDEIGVAKCPNCGRFWDGLSCESCQYAVAGSSPLPKERE